MILTHWIIGLALVFPAPAFANELTAPSVWENQSGSLLYVDEIDADGRFAGRYVNGAVGYACQGIEYDVEGRIFDPLITFDVVWRAEAETCHTITSWTGEVSGDVIETEWSLVRVNAAGEFGRFEGVSRFERQD
jgi:hypothetical protein